ncbi:MAG: UPF0280 family protein [Syntrophomonadaceae bacterium]|mgnify:CR=1 FL=1|nr:UPF0280 family protein [Syntrophomonadaceae bacterium]
MRDDFTTRSYRSRHQGEDLTYFRICLKQTDLSIGINSEAYAPSLENRVMELVARLRADLETYITLHPVFFSSLVPVPLKAGAPEIARIMAGAAAAAGVGPMAAVAGAFAQEVGHLLEDYSSEVIVENGGDIYIKTTRDRLVGVIAGSSPFSNRLAVKIKKEESPVGICTSSGTVGPSFSKGKADAALVKAPQASLADAVATGVGNRILTEQDLKDAVEYAREIPGVTGVLAIKNDQLAAWGDIELMALDNG